MSTLKQYIAYFISYFVLRYSKLQFKYNILLLLLFIVIISIYNFLFKFYYFILF